MPHTLWCQWWFVPNIYTFFKVKTEKLEKYAKNWNFRFCPLMVVIICGKYGNNKSRTENVTRSNDLEDIGQGQRSSHVTHLLMLVIICTKYGKNPSRADTIFKAKAKWPWRYMSRSKVIICNTPSHTIDHLCKIWKESIKNCRSFFQGQSQNLFKFAKNSNFQILKKKCNTRHTH